MCGIAGIAYKPDATPVAQGTLNAMAAALHHRGPDGTHFARMPRIDLIHTRLSIIDLKGGDQPLTTGTGTLVANGEIYNDLHIRQAFGKDRFKTGSDCESPLVMWEQTGADYTACLRGMYAIALYDSSRDLLLLSRDPFGIKPLYITEGEFGVAFASEPEVLLQAGFVARAERTDALHELLQLQFTTGRNTLFERIQRVMPGETLHIQSGRIIKRQTQPALPRASSLTPFTSETEALAALDQALMDSIAAHERSDVPFGLFLSGGIDSASLLTGMRRLNTSEKLRTWTATFSGSTAADESDIARELAQAAQAEHETVSITEAMVWQHLPAIVACMDDPAADYAIIPTWFLARKAAEEVRVVLSGEGGDELFCGYGRYRSATRPWWRGKRPMWRKGMFDGLDVLRASPAGWRDGISLTEGMIPAPPSPLSAVQSVDVAEWLPNDLLLKLDRCLMAHGLEGRTPFLDPVIAACAWRLPDTLRVNKNKGKWLLRRWLEQHCPAARPFAPKQGFTVPVGHWIAQQGQRLGGLVARQDSIQAIAHPDRVRALFKEASGRKAAPAAWTLLFYALWHRTHIRALPSQGDVFETLST